MVAIALVGSLGWTTAACPLNPDIDLGGEPERPTVVIPPPPPLTNPSDAGVRPDPGPDDAGRTFIDLSLEQMSDPPRQLRPGDRSPVSFVVQGRGFEPSPATRIEVMLVPEDPTSGGRTDEVASILVPELGPDDTIEVFGDLTLPPSVLPTDYRLEAIIDPQDKIDELQEFNNKLVSNTIAVSSVEIRPIEIDFGVVGLDCRAQREFTVTNAGDSFAFVRDMRLPLGASFELEKKQAVERNAWTTSISKNSPRTNTQTSCHLARPRVRVYWIDRSRLYPTVLPVSRSLPIR